MSGNIGAQVALNTSRIILPLIQSSSSSSSDSSIRLEIATRDARKLAEIPDPNPGKRRWVA